MPVYRITKYNPKNRDEHGNYKIVDEWTDFSDVEKKCTMKEYEQVELNYLDFLYDMLNNIGVYELEVNNLEDDTDVYMNSEILNLEESMFLCKEILRNERWATLSDQKIYISFGFDYYMYIEGEFDKKEIDNLCQKYSLFSEVMKNKVR